MHKVEKAAVLYESLHKNIGYLCATFADIETRLSEILVLLINEDNPAIGEIVVESLPFSKAIDLLRRLVFEYIDMDEDDAREFTGLIDRLREVAKGRNDVVHSRWYLPDADSSNFIKEGARRKREKTANNEDMLLIKVVELCERADSVSNEVDDFKTSMWGWI
ncbi:MAG: hypothetical protein K9N49_05055 [Candidatus Marinimicrobia bacterium]|nr:hypothetical protein [Candidatus Neomarinimicrobiota bacterium]